MAAPPSGTPLDPAFGRRSVPWLSGERALVLGILGWLVVMISLWPGGLSFEDDVGYAGEAKLMLAGRVRPQPGDVGVWVRTSRGTFPKFPLLPSVLLVPLMAAGPKLAFLLGMSSAIGLCWITGRILREWGTDPVWALLVLAHPTIVILARTITADLPLSAFAVGAWWALRRHRRVMAIVLIGALLPTKATGFLLALALAGGELLRLLPALRLRERDAWMQVATIAAGLAVGAAVLVATNEISAGKPGFAYDLSFLGTPPFWFTYFPRSAPANLRTYLLLPPLLILGLGPFWRRREWGPMALVVGLGTMMCFYFFVDTGTNQLESLILAPRLVLPVVSFLMIGYAQVIARAAARLRLGERMTSPAIILGTIVIALTISVRHRRWQTPMQQALAAATQAARELGVDELGVTPEAAKAGTLFSGATRLVTQSSADTPVVLCSSRAASYRQSLDLHYSCRYPGYRPYFDVADYRVLVRMPPSAAPQQQTTVPN
jgi:hypothetical protein